MKPRSPQNGNKKKWFVIFIVLAILLPLIGVFVIRFENTKPIVFIDLPSQIVGPSFQLKGRIADQKTGLRNIRIGVLKDGGEEKNILDMNFPKGPIYKGGKTSSYEIDLPVAPKNLGLKDGIITLRVSAVDFSWRNWGKGSTTTNEYKLTVDTTSPEIDVLTTTHNVTQGGSGLVIYRVSETGGVNGVYVNDIFYPGYSGYFEDEHIYFNLFALKPDDGRDATLYISSTDAAGNQSRAGFSYYIRKRNYKKDTIPISDRFLNWKMPEFDTVEFGISDQAGIEKFLAVNGKLRMKNGRQIKAPANDPARKIYWHGPFIRLSGSATRATFADYRSYVYKGKVVDHQFHMGIDLASVKRSPVPAANAGKVALTEDIGIYGKTVVIDHGFGLFSVYSHLSEINTSVGKEVEKDEVIGHTGTTGLAVGDHLHFSVFVHKTFVNPIEWWDGEWIKNNITSKFNVAAPAAG